MRRLLVAPALVAAALLYALVDPDTGLRSCVRLRRDLERAHARVAVLEHEIARLRSHAAAMREDPVALEAAIREDLELARPGETVVKIGRSGAEARDFLDALERAGDSPAP